MNHKRRRESKSEKNQMINALKSWLDRINLGLILIGKVLVAHLHMHTHTHTHILCFNIAKTHVCVCVCVCERERER